MGELQQRLDVLHGEERLGLGRRRQSLHRGGEAVQRGRDRQQGRVTH
jgi:hypothetical protein